MRNPTYASTLHAAMAESKFQLDGHSLGTPKRVRYLSLHAVEIEMNDSRAAMGTPSTGTWAFQMSALIFEHIFAPADADWNQIAVWCERNQLLTYLRRGIFCGYDRGIGRRDKARLGGCKVIGGLRPGVRNRAINSQAGFEAVED